MLSLIPCRRKEKEKEGCAHLVQPMYAKVPNMGHPTRGKGLGANRENKGRIDSHPQNRAKVVPSFFNGWV